MTPQLDALHQVVAERGVEVVRARDVLRALQELAQVGGMENNGAMANAVEKAREDAESAVLLWLSARAELYRWAEARAEMTA